MEHLHEELRRAREKAGLSQQALAQLAGIPRNQVVRAERGENITIDTLRRIVAFLPVTELTLMDTKGLRVDIIADPEKIFIGALENVRRLSEALLGAIHLTMDAAAAVDAAHRTAEPSPDGEETPDDAPSLLLLRRLQRVSNELTSINKETKVAS